MNFATKKEAQAYAKVWEQDTRLKHRVVRYTRTLVLAGEKDVRWCAVLRQPIQRMA